MTRNKPLLLLLIVSIALIEWYWVFLYATTFVEISILLLVIAFFLLGNCFVSMEMKKELWFYNKLCVVSVLLLIICMLLL